MTDNGLRVRRNGSEYYPRVLGGMSDVDFYHRAQKRQKHILLAGPPGTGKTAGFEAAFDSVPEGEDFPVDAPLGMETIVGTTSTKVEDFVGSYVQNPETRVFEWVHGPLIRSIINDVPLLIDEIAIIDPGVLALLYPLMDGRGVLEVQSNPSLPPYYIGENWMVLGAYNPDVPGAVISEALHDRFDYEVEVKADWRLAVDMGVPPEIVAIMSNLSLRQARGDIAWSPQFRSAVLFKEDMDDFGLNFAIQNLLGKTPRDDREIVKRAFADANVGDSNRARPLSLGGRYIEDSGNVENDFL